MRNIKPIRIIARLDIKGYNLIKGVNFEGLRVLGNPAAFASKYYEEGIDEIFLHDSVASLYGRNSLDQIIFNLSKSIFVPLTVSGGLRSLADIERVLKAGADKVCLNTAAINNPNLINQAVTKYGSSTIIIAIDYIKDLDGEYKCLIENGREITVGSLGFIGTGATISNQINITANVIIGAGGVVIADITEPGTYVGIAVKQIK